MARTKSLQDLRDQMQRIGSYVNGRPFDNARFVRANNAYNRYQDNIFNSKRGAELSKAVGVAWRNNNNSPGAKRRYKDAYNKLTNAQFSRRAYMGYNTP